MAHVPVLVDEVVKCLDPQTGEKFIDATIGSGGHTRALLEKLGTRGSLLGIDRDPAAIEKLKKSALGRDARVTLVHASYRDIATLAREHKVAPADGILFDLGFSSPQIEDPTRGFSFQTDGPLDMRYDSCHMERTAAAIVNGATERTLVEILREYGEEPRARKIVAAIITTRRQQRIIGTRQLVDIIHAVAGQGGKIDSATRTFQALRIAVNDELNELAQTLPQAIGLLVPQARLAVISFHSLEDRIVKTTFRAYASEGSVKLINKKPITPSQKEIQSNPRSRSAKLRLIEKMP